MIYLIWWTPKCWKTTLTKILSKSLQIPWVSTDTLQSVIKPYFNTNDLINNFPSSSQRCKDNDEKFSKFSTNEIIDAYKIQAKTLQKAIEMFILSEITDWNDFIIEWYHIEPEFVNEMNLKYPNKIKSVFIFKTNEKGFIEDIKKSSTPNDWIISRTNYPETYWKIAKMICNYWSFFDKESKKYNMKSFSMDDNFEDKIQEIINYFKN
mgnify:CR=1 FL=1